MAYVLDNPKSHIGKAYKNAKGNTECVEFIAQTLNTPLTSAWKEGKKVTGDTSVMSGTAIATFKTAVDATLDRHLARPAPFSCATCSSTQSVRRGELKRKTEGALAACGNMSTGSGPRSGHIQRTTPSALDEPPSHASQGHVSLPAHRLVRQPF